MPSSLTQMLLNKVLKILLSVKAKKRTVLSCRRWAISSKMADASSWTSSVALPVSLETFTVQNEILQHTVHAKRISDRYHQNTVRQTLTYLIDDVVNMIRLKHHALQHAGFTGSHSSVKNRSVTSESISQVTGVPPLLQHVLKVISFLQHWVSMLFKGNHHTALETCSFLTINIFFWTTKHAIEKNKLQCLLWLISYLVLKCWVVYF